jgi:hypothetical protein
MDTSKPAAGGHGVAAEPDRIPARTVVGFAIVLTIVAIVAMVLMVVFFRRLEGRAEKRDDAAIASAGLEFKRDKVPPLPRLQVYPVQHWNDFRDAEKERLSTYGWMDRATGSVHVPIERAMDLIAVRGVGPLPVAPAATTLGATEAKK